MKKIDSSQLIEFFEMLDNLELKKPATQRTRRRNMPNVNITERELEMILVALHYTKEAMLNVPGDKAMLENLFMELENETPFTAEELDDLSVNICSRVEKQESMEH